MVSARPLRARQFIPMEAVFFDKDGTLVEDVPYNTDAGNMRLAAGAAIALQLLHANGFRLIVISNQSGVARGYFSEQALEGVECRLRELIKEAGAPLAGFYYCPHHPDGIVPGYAIACDCRKPAPGMILRAAAEQGIDLNKSWMIGDILDDIESAHRAGCAAILLDNGNETEWRVGADRVPDHIASGLEQAARYIIEERA